MLAAAISLAFHGLLRVSEFTAPSPITHHATRTLQTRHINIDMINNSLSVFTLASKTYQQAQGHKILRQQVAKKVAKFRFVIVSARSSRTLHNVREPLAHDFAS